MESPHPKVRAVTLEGQGNRHHRERRRSDDVLVDDGKVYDTARIMFLRGYLTQLQRATADGVPVKGYFQWSTMDSFEWNAGFGNRFGLVYVDFKTQKRMPKLSAAWFREAATSNRVR